MRGPPNRIAEWRSLRNWAMQDLAERVGTTASTISKLEKGQMRLTDVWLNRLATAIECRPAEVLFEIPDPLSIDAGLLRRACDAVDQIIAGTEGRKRAAAYPDLLAAMYDFLAEAKAEGHDIGDATLRSVVASNRAVWRRFKFDQT